MMTTRTELNQYEYASWQAMNCLNSVLFWTGYTMKSRGYTQQSTLYRVIAPAHELKKDGVSCFHLLQDQSMLVIPTVKRNHINHVILHRINESDEVNEIIRNLKELGVNLIYDIDDNLFDSEIVTRVMPLITYPKNLQDEVREYIKKIISVAKKCDQVVVSTEPLRDAALKLSLKTVVIPNNIPAFFTSGLYYSCDSLDNYSAHFKIYYGPGSKDNSYQFDICASAVLKILHKYPFSILILGGGLDLPNEFSDVENRVLRIPKLIPRAYFRFLREVDVILAPIYIDEFSICKSWIKILEAETLGIPWIASNMPDYFKFKTRYQSSIGTIVDSSTDQDGWFNALTFLIEKNCDRNS